MLIDPVGGDAGDPSERRSEHGAASCSAVIREPRASEASLGFLVILRAESRSLVLPVCVDLVLAR